MHFFIEERLFLLLFYLSSHPSRTQIKVANFSHQQPFCIIILPQNSCSAGQLLSCVDQAVMPQVSVAYFMKILVPIAYLMTQISLLYGQLVRTIKALKYIVSLLDSLGRGKSAGVSFNLMLEFKVFFLGHPFARHNNITVMGFKKAWNSFHC